MSTPRDALLKKALAQQKMPAATKEDKPIGIVHKMIDKHKKTAAKSTLSTQATVSPPTSEYMKFAKAERQNIIKLMPESNEDEVNEEIDRRWAFQSSAAKKKIVEKPAEEPAQKKIADKTFIIAHEMSKEEMQVAQVAFVSQVGKGFMYTNVSDDAPLETVHGIKDKAKPAASGENGRSMASAKGLATTVDSAYTETKVKRERDEGRYDDDDEAVKWAMNFAAERMCQKLKTEHWPAVDTLLTAFGVFPNGSNKDKAEMLSLQLHQETDDEAEDEDA